MGIESIEVLVGPGIGTSWVDTDCQVLIQPYAEPQFPGVMTCRLKLKLGLPLQVLVKLNPPGMAGGKAGNGFRVWIPVRVRPCLPAPDGGIFVGKVFL